MEFVFKSQIIRGDITEEGNSITLAHEFKNDDDAILRRRGRLFIVLRAKAKENLDLKPATSIFLETVQKEYFRLNDDTPMHAVEKALNKALTDMVATKDQGQTVSNPIKITFSTALIWNRVLYTSYLGPSSAYLIRGAGVRDLSITDNVNQVCTNSSILTSNDVIVIGTPMFKKVFPTDKIIDSIGNITNTVKAHPKNEAIAAMIIKVSSKDKPKSRFAQNLSKINFKAVASNGLWRLKEKLFRSDALFEKFRFHQRKKIAPVSTIGNLSFRSTTQVGISSRIKPKRLNSHSEKKVKSKKLVAGVLTLLGIVYLNYQLLTASKNKPNRYDINSRLTAQETSAVKGESNIKNPYPTFININHVGEGISPIAMSATKDKLIILTNTALYSVDIKTKEPKEIYSKFENPHFMVCDIKLCYVYGGGVLHVLNPETPLVIDSYSIDLGNPVLGIYPFSNNVYFITDSEIYRLALQEKAPVKWLQNDGSISSPISFAVNGDVFVLSERSIYKFTGGVKNERFSIDNSYLLNPKVIKSSGNYVYVLDMQPGNDKNLVVYNKNTGDFAKKITLAERTDAESPSLFTVLKDEKTVIFKKGDYLYKIENANILEK